MKKIHSAIIGTLLSASLSSVAFANPWSVVDTSVGKVFAGEQGLSLYTWKNDSPNQSNCYDDCAHAWPPFFAAADAKAAGEWTLVKRKDGKMQWAHKGAPVYYWVGDAVKGDITGDGVGGTWDLARP